MRYALLALLAFALVAVLWVAVIGPTLTEIRAVADQLAY